MQAEIKGSNLVITIPADLDPKPSKSGKSRMVATTGGFVTTTALVKGKPIKIGLNAVIPLE